MPRIAEDGGRCELCLKKLQIIWAGKALVRTWDVSCVDAEDRPRVWEGFGEELVFELPLKCVGMGSIPANETG